MSNRPFFSTIIPVYNSEEYLEQCVGSILDQQFGDYELLLVDDGSTDGSAAICQRFSRSDNRVRYCRKNNGGTSAARNKGIELALGKYLIFVDNDDCWVSIYALSELRETIELTGADLIMHQTFNYVGEPPSSSPLAKTSYRDIVNSMEKSHQIAFLVREACCARRYGQKFVRPISLRKEMAKAPFCFLSACVMRIPTGLEGPCNYAKK